MDYTHTYLLCRRKKNLVPSPQGTDRAAGLAGCHRRMTTFKKNKGAQVKSETGSGPPTPGRAGSSSPGEEASRAQGPFSCRGSENACSRCLLRHKAGSWSSREPTAGGKRRGYLRAGFLHLSHTDVGAGEFFAVRAVLCTAGCSVVSLVSTH